MLEAYKERYEELLEQCKKDANFLPELLPQITGLGTHCSPEEAKVYLLKTEEVYRLWEGKLDSIQALKYLTRSLVYYFMANFEDSLEACRKATEHLSGLNDSNLIGLNYMIYGMSYRAIGRIDEAVDSLYKSADLITNPVFAVFDCYSHYQLGEINLAIQDVQTARAHYLRAKEVGEEHALMDPLFRIYNGLGNLFMQEGDMERALEYFMKTLELPNASDFQKSRTYCDLGEYYLIKGDPKQSVDYAQKSYEIRSSMGFGDAATTSLFVLAEANIALDDPKKAIDMLQEAEQNIFKYKSQLKLSRCYRLLAKAEKEIGNFKESIDYYEKYISLEKENKSRQIQRIYKLKNTQIEQQKKEIEVVHQEIQDSIQYAKRIQEAIMPNQSEMISRLGDSFVLYLPKDVVSGDFFWMETVSDTSLRTEVKQSAHEDEIASGSLNSRNDIVYFAAADCTGHGVPGAMVSVVCSNALNKALLEEGVRDTGMLLDRTREIVIDRLAKSGEEVKDGMDISLCALDMNKLALNWSGANNPMWIIRKGSDLVEEYKPNKQPIGVYGKSEPFTMHSIQLQKGDVVYVFTDGYQDQFGGPKGKKYKASQLKSLVLSIQNQSMEEQKKILYRSLKEWQGNHEQLDDVCVIGVRI